MIPTRRPTRLPIWLARVMSRVYGSGVARNNRGWDTGKGVVRLDRPVISIGNLSAGGTGKTPLVQWVARELVGAGHRPAIAMRGYKSGPGQSSDEEREHRSALPDVPVVAQPDRVSGLNALFSTHEGASVDCVVLDDGFQHRRIARDLDVVVIDATRPPDRDALLPLGYLREPVDNLERADVVVISHGEAAGAEEIDRIVGWVGSVCRDGVRIGVMRHEWVSLRDPGSGEDLGVPWLEDRSVGVVSAIGNPDALGSMVLGAGARVEKRWDLPDHDPYSDSTLRRIGGEISGLGIGVVLMTRKDWVKVEGREGMLGGARVVIPELGVGWARGGDEIRAMCVGVVSG